MLDIQHGLDLSEGTLYLIMLDKLILANDFHCVIFFIQFTLHFVNLAESSSVKVLDNLEVTQGNVINRSFTFDKRRLRLLFNDLDLLFILFVWVTEEIIAFLYFIRKQLLLY